MSVLSEEVRALLDRIPHDADCAIRGDVNPEGPCDCTRSVRVAEAVAEAIEAAITADNDAPSVGEAINKAQEAALSVLRKAGAP